MTPHSIPPSSPPGGEKTADVDMRDGDNDDAAPQNKQNDGNAQGDDSDDKNDNDNDSSNGNDGGNSQKRKPAKSSVNLEELFDAEDSDEEFSSSAAVQPANGDEEADNDDRGRAVQASM